MPTEWEEVGAGTGLFSDTINQFNPVTSYYIRAYATNSRGTSYGTDIPFTTPLTSIGATYEGGIVFYIDGTGHSGLVCAPSDQGNYQWGPSEMDYIGAQDPTVGSGAQNTIDIVNACGNDTTAASICDTLTLNGYADWFLPSRDEMSLIFNNLYLKV